MSIDTSDQRSVWRDYYLGIQGLFYFAQGIAMGALLFLTAFLDYLFLSPFERILVQAIIWIPWYLKIIFGLLSDNLPIGKYGRRKPYIFLAGIFGIIGWVTLPMHTIFTPLLIVSGILASLGTSMSDATIDALAVDITPPKKRGAMQGVSWGTRGLGVGISGLVVGILADMNQWFIIYAIPGVIVAFSCFLVLLFEEVPLPTDFKRVPLSTYSKVFKSPNVLICIVFNIFAGAAIAILPILQTFLDEELGFNNTTIGIILTVFAVGMFIGAILFGFLGDRVSVRITLPITTIVYAFVIVSALLTDLSVVNIAAIFFFTVGLANGGYEATQMRISMDNSPPIVSGTVYNLYNSISNIGQIAVGALAIAAFVEFVANYAVGWQLAWVFLLIALLPAYILITKYQEEPQEEEEDQLALP